MTESFLLAGYVGVTPSRRADWMDRAVPDPYLTISNCLADDLLVPEFYGWFQDLDEAVAAASDAARLTPLLAIGIACPDADVLLGEYADQPYYFSLLQDRLPLPQTARVLGFELIGIESGLSFHSWYCHGYADEVARELGVTVSSLGLIDVMKERGLRSWWVPGGCWGCSSHTFEEAPCERVCAPAVRRDRSASSAQCVGAHGRRRAAVGDHPDQ